MPARNSKKIYIEGYCYHVYNRGVDKRIIFQDHKDYVTFLHFFRMYLDPDFVIGYIDSTGNLIKERKPHSVSGKVSLNCYCLMPNHFHLLITLNNKTGMTDLIRKVSVNYVNYFNNKYQRSGRLFEGVYKASLINSQKDFLYVSQYIHLNPYEIAKENSVLEYKYSSLLNLVNKDNPNWLDISRYGNSKNIENYINLIKDSENTIRKANNRLDYLIQNFDTIKELTFEPLD